MLLVACSGAVVASHRHAGVQGSVRVDEAPVHAVHATKAPGTELGVQRLPRSTSAGHFQPAEALQQCLVSWIGACLAWAPLELQVLLMQEGTLHIDHVGVPHALSGGPDLLCIGRSWRCAVVQALCAGNFP